MTNTPASLTKTIVPTFTIPAIERKTFSSTAITTVERQSPSLDTTCENRLQAALEHARRLTQMRGCQGANVAIAWETVEELRTAQRKRLLPSTPSCQVSFEHYCSQNPHALECRSYDC